MRGMKLGILDGPNKIHQAECVSTLLYCVAKGLVSRDNFVKAKEIHRALLLPVRNDIKSQV